jgi:3'-5' exoribonuclease
MARPFVTELVEGGAVTGFFLVGEIQVRQKRTGEAYLLLRLADRTGEVGAVLWEGAETVTREVGLGDVVKVQGVLGTYHDEPQLTVSRMRKAAPEEVNLPDYLPQTKADVVALEARLREAVAGLGEPSLRRLLEGLLEDPAFVEAFRTAPAATHIHHAVLGGLLEHTVSVVGLCQMLADYYPVLDRDLLCAAAILHDVGKIQELRWDRRFDYTDSGRLLGHITLGTLLVEERIRTLPDFPPELAMRLLHCILSHHGELEWGSPKRPKTLEALVLHEAENLDGKVNGFLAFAERHMDSQRPGWTQYNRTLERYLYPGPGEGTGGGRGAP